MEHDSKKGADLPSLSAAPDYNPAEAARIEREAKRPKTTFQELKAQLPEVDRRPHRRTATDAIIDSFTPFLIFLMVYTLTFFLLDVRFIHSEVHDTNLRFVVLCMVVGIVALNRVVARDGSEESMLYILLLGGSMGFYTWMTTGTYDVGSVAPGFLDTPGMAALFNMTAVAILWWATNRLMHECCIDENRTAGDIGILTGTMRRFQISIRRDTSLPKIDKKKKSRRAVGYLVESDEIQAIDPLDWKDPDEEKKAAPPPAEAPSKRLATRHPGISIFYFSVPAMAIFALGLPVLMAGGDAYVRAGHVYVAVYTLCALALLMLTSLGGLRQYFRSRRVAFPASIGWFWVGLGSVMIAAVMTGALQMPLPDLPKAAIVTDHVYDYWRPNSTFQLIVSPGASAADVIEQTRFIDRVGQVVLVAMGLFLLYSALRGLGGLASAVGRHREWFPDWVIDLFTALDAFLERVIRLPKLPKRQAILRVRPDVAKSTPFRNPMAGEGGAGADAQTREYIATSYDALCALAEDLGVPRGVDQTPYEFLRAFPKELKGLRKEARELTHMYVRSAYSELAMDEKALDRLRKFWMSYEKTRARYIR